jgi:hypothetical protein
MGCRTRCRATVLRNTADGMVGQLLIVLRSDHCFSRLNVSWVVDVVCAWGITGLLDTNEVSMNFCTRQRRIRLGEAEKWCAKRGSDESKTYDHLRHN